MSYKMIDKKSITEGLVTIRLFSHRNIPPGTS